jgi:general secretion pathway protein D
VTVIEEHNQLIVRSSDPKAMQEIRDLVCRLDVPTPVVLLEVKVLQINLSDEFASMFDFQFTDNVLSAGGFSPGPPNQGFSSGNILPPFANLAPSRFTPISPGPVGTTPPQNLLFQVVSANFRARLQLLESKNRVTELATPLLMTANNEVSRIFSGVTQPITTGFTPSQIVATGVTAATTLIGTPVTTLQDIGTTLLITPNVNADRTVTLRILEENSADVPHGATIPVPNASGLITQVPVDTVSRQTISGTVVAMDGETLAFGGLIQESVNDSRSEVPVLGKVPGLGFFFRAQDTKRTRTELVIMIRPFVLTTPCESRDASRSLLEALSIHPNVPRGGLGTLGSYVPAEVIRPDPPRSELQKIFKTHVIVPKDY